MVPKNLKFMCQHENAQKFHYYIQIFAKNSNNYTIIQLSDPVNKG